MDYEGASDPFF